MLPVLSESSFVGKRALVTGAGKGIGRCIALELLKSGCLKVVGVARTRADLDSLALECSSFKGTFVGVVADLSSVEECKRAATAAFDAEPQGLDSLVNSAGTGKTQPFLEVTEDAWEAVFAVNLRAVMFLSQAVAQRWCSDDKEQGGRAIVNISSVPSGATGMPDRAAYCSSKGGLNQLTRVMALELGPFNIRVNAVSPTVTMTEMGKVAWGDPDKSAPMLAHIPLCRFPEPVEVANVCLWLLTDAASMVHGANIPVDGGFTAIGAAVVKPRQK